MIILTVYLLISLIFFGLAVYFFCVDYRFITIADLLGCLIAALLWPLAILFIIGAISLLLLERLVLWIAKLTKPIFKKPANRIKSILNYRIRCRKW